MSQTKQKPFEIRFDRIVLAYKTVKANRGSHAKRGEERGRWAFLRSLTGLPRRW